MIEETLQDQTMDQAVELLLSKGIPAGPIYDIQQIMQDPQVKERDMFIRMEHPTLGEITVNGCAIKLNDTPASVDTPAPALGQDNGEILKEYLGLEDGVLREYRERGIV